MRSCGLRLLTLALGFAVALLSWTSPRRAHACSCIAPDPARDASTHPVVFYGRVLRERRVDGERVVDVRVVRAWRGVRAGAVLTIHNDDSPVQMCPIPVLRRGERWLLFAQTALPGPEIGLGACNPSKRVGLDSADVRAVEAAFASGRVPRQTDQERAPPP